MGFFGSTDSDALKAWMDKYCKEHPLDSVYMGTLELMDELNERVDD